MYQVSNASSLVVNQRRLWARGAARPGVSRTVVLLGVTSMLTDISAEMVATVLPLYLVYVGQFTPAAFGVVDGIQRGAAAIAGLVGGYVGDRSGRHKEVAATGYGLSALVKLGLATLGTALSAIGTLVLVDRIGKGIRTAPRDAMISLATPRDELGAAFGVHRALDTTGAMLGPLVAFAILALAVDAYTAVFVVSFCIAALGLAVLVLLVPRAAAQRRDGGHQRIALREALGACANRRFRRLAISAGALAFATVGDAFIFLVLQDELDLDVGLFPLLFVGMTLVYMLLAVPVGRLADRAGRGRVLVAGYALLLVVYAALLSPLDGALLVALALLALGTFYAATDGVLAAYASAVTPERVRGSALALLNTTTGLAKLLSSVTFGVIWTLAGTETAIVVFAAGLVGAIAIAAVVLARAHEEAAHAG